jgi:SAM-dependent methyltransferase
MSLTAREAAATVRRVISQDEVPDPGDWREANLAMWDERVPIHLRSDFYDLNGFRDNRDQLRGFEIDEVGEVSGKQLLHLQCHIGTDTLSWAQRGAVVTGLDFSGPAVAAARVLASELGFEPGQARFVQADVYDAPKVLDGELYDIVYTGLGALCWLPDMPRWARTVASLLAPGGFLYLAEFHPVGFCLGPDGTAFDADYIRSGAIVADESGTYADPSAETQYNRSVWWQHTLGDVVSAVAAAGLRLEFLHEFDFTLFELIPGLVKAGDTSGSGASSGTVYRLPDGAPRVPLLFSLRAARD